MVFKGHRVTSFLLGRLTDPARQGKGGRNVRSQNSKEEVDYANVGPFKEKAPSLGDRMVDVPRIWNLPHG